MSRPRPVGLERPLSSPAASIKPVNTPPTSQSSPFNAPLTPTTHHSIRYSSPLSPFISSSTSPKKKIAPSSPSRKYVRYNNNNSNNSNNSNKEEEPKIERPKACGILWRQIDPYEVIRVRADSKLDLWIKVYIFGPRSRKDILLCVGGGPGVPCNYLRDSHGWLSEERTNWTVVCYDPVGTGESDIPEEWENPDSLWSVEKCAEEIEAVRRVVLGCSYGEKSFHILAHDTGVLVALEHCLKYRDTVSSLVLCGGAGDMYHFSRELDAIRNRMGEKNVATLQKYERIGRTLNAEYSTLISELESRHICSMQKWPSPLVDSLTRVNQDFYTKAWGPSQWCFQGSYREWNRLSELHCIRCPVLLLYGEHDIYTPACAERLLRAFPPSFTDRVLNKIRTRVKFFEISAHYPFFEEPLLYFCELLKFMDNVATSRYHRETTAVQ